jgi:alpha-mannosidase
LENAYIKTIIYENGKIDILFKETGKLYRDILKLEDTADHGDAYVFGRSSGDTPITSDGVVPVIECLADSGLMTEYKLTYNLLLPEGYNESARKRNDKLVLNCVEIELSLKKDSPWLDIGFNIENKSCDHRLRVLVKTGIQSDYTAASIPFDIRIRDRKDILRGINSDGTQPNSGFVDLYDSKEGIAVLNEGVYEYEHLLDGEGILAFTLFRANPYISRIGDSEAIDGSWYAAGNQCLREIQLAPCLFYFSLFIIP